MPNVKITDVVQIERKRGLLLISADDYKKRGFNECLDELDTYVIDEAELAFQLWQKDYQYPDHGGIDEKFVRQAWDKFKLRGKYISLAMHLTANAKQWIVKKG